MYSIGYKLIEEFSFSQEDVNIFSQISDDSNPIHLDKEYAKNTIFKNPIIHGFLGGSIFSKMLGTDLYGSGTIYLKQNLKFCKPMYVDIKYIASLKILDINRDKNRASVETRIVDTNNNLIIDGDALIQNEKIY